jgi:hypothetical protein
MRTTRSRIRLALVCTLVVCAVPIATVSVAGQDTASEGEFVVTTSSGDQFCLSAIEGNDSVQRFYGYQGSGSDSRGGETGFEQAETATLLLYRSTSTGNLSLVFLHGSANESDLRRAKYDLTGFEGANWLVQDDPESFPYDSYGFTDGAPTYAQWRWQGGTDGGALGPLGDSVDVSVNASSQDVSTWRVIGSDGSVAGTIPVDGAVDISTASADGPCGPPAGTTEETGSSSDGGDLPLVPVVALVLALLVAGGAVWYRQN